MPLLARFVLSFVGDLLFDASASRVRAGESEIDRYFDERGFRPPAGPRPK